MGFASWKMWSASLMMLAAIGLAAVIAAPGFHVAKVLQAAEPSGGLPPLVVDNEKPLLLDDPDPEQEPTGPPSINQACYVCHANYEEEPFAQQHAKEKVGCIDCHGKSFAHRDDEDNVTPPDVMFPPEKIEENCSDCHDEHDVAAAEVIARWLERCPEKKDPKGIVCTDCHGQHRLKKRTVRWDKRTGKLVEDKQ